MVRLPREQGVDIASAAELKAIVKILEADHSGEATSKDVALLIVEAIDAEREKTKKFVTAGLISYTMNDRATRKMFCVGPFTTELQAKRAGESWACDPKSRRGEGRSTVLEILPNGKDAWESIRPVEKSKDEMLHERNMEYIHNYEAGLWKDMYKDKVGW